MQTSQSSLHAHRYSGRCPLSSEPQSRSTWHVLIFTSVVGTGITLAGCCCNSPCFITCAGKYYSEKGPRGLAGCQRGPRRELLAHTPHFQLPAWLCPVAVDSGDEPASGAVGAMEGADSGVDFSTGPGTLGRSHPIPLQHYRLSPRMIPILQVGKPRLTLSAPGHQAQAIEPQIRWVTLGYLPEESGISGQAQKASCRLLGCWGPCLTLNSNQPFPTMQFRAQVCVG